MKLFGFNITRSQEVQSETYQSYSTPFRNVGEENLSLPYVKSWAQNRYVPFGKDNLYPQLLNQLYYTSPLHSSIVNFIVNSVLGGGYELDTSGKSTSEEIEIMAFEKKTRLPKLVRRVLLDRIIHNRIYILGVKKKNGKATYKTIICPSKIRTNNDKSAYYYCDDWETMRGIKELKRYKDAEADKEFLWVYENTTIGQDIYPLPEYSSANNWMFLDGEMSYLQKSNIINSVFPSFIINFPRKSHSDEEKRQIKNTIDGLKGARNSGKSAAFFGMSKDDMPEFIPIPTSNNDSLFYQTTESIDSKICQAHTIDPILMGIRVSGKLGSGSDIKQSYVIFEKNKVMPLRDETEEIFNELFYLFDVDTKITINDYQIIGDQIVDKTEEE